MKGAGSMVNRDSPLVTFPPSVKLRVWMMPVTRARTSTSREPSVCPVNSKFAGSVFCSTAITETCAGGMPPPGPWPPLPSPPGPQAASGTRSIREAMCLERMAETSRRIAMLCRKKLLQGGQRASQRRMVDRAQRLAEFAAPFRHLPRSRRLALAPERRDRGAQAAPVRGIVDAPHQLVGFEPVHELRDVGAHAGTLRGEFTQRHRLVRLHQMGQRDELGARHFHLCQGLLEAALDRARRPHQRPHDVVGARGRTAAARGAAFVHICTIQLCDKARQAFSPYPVLKIQGTTNMQARKNPSVAARL